MKTVTITTIAFVFMIAVWALVQYQKSEDQWGKGYGDCMESVIRTLVKCDEVRIGNLVIDEPNAYVTNITFFALDPNLFIEMNGANSTLTDSTFSCMVSDDFKDRFESKPEIEQRIEWDETPGIIIEDITFAEPNEVKE